MFNSIIIDGNIKCLVINKFDVPSTKLDSTFSSLISASGGFRKATLQNLKIINKIDLDGTYIRITTNNDRVIPFILEKLSEVSEL